MSRLTFYLLDVFSQHRYGGNQLAVFTNCAHLTSEEMQQIAREINFSETTFIVSETPIDGAYPVRIFTPSSEIPFAGHPVLGTAYVIRNLLKLTDDFTVSLKVPLDTISIKFVASQDNEQILHMRQVPPNFGEMVAPQAVADIFALDVSEIDTRYPIQSVDTGFPSLIVPLKNRHSLETLQLQNDAYSAYCQTAQAKNILVFCQQGFEADEAISVRVFAGYYGVPEDAATGSANGALAAYLSHHSILGQQEFEVTVGQGYGMGRPSKLFIKVEQANTEPHIYVGGHVVSVAQGYWN